MLVDITQHDDRLNININMVFPKIPCDLLTLDVQDVMGTHIVDIAGSLFKKRIDEKGVVLS
jgi:Endoplasmic Reticulum-Golgi Intermediate Compartment (ERGIC)